MNTNALLTALRDARAAFQVLDATIGVLETELAGGPAAPPPAAPAAAAKPAATPAAAAPENTSSEPVLSADRFKQMLIHVSQQGYRSTIKNNMGEYARITDIPADERTNFIAKLIDAGVPKEAFNAAPAKEAA